MSPPKPIPGYIPGSVKTEKKINVILRNFLLNTQRRLQCIILSLRYVYLHRFVVFSRGGEVVCIIIKNYATGVVIHTEYKPMN